jgi:hypothetical protein
MAVRSIDPALIDPARPSATGNSFVPGARRVWQDGLGDVPTPCMSDRHPGEDQFAKADYSPTRTKPGDAQLGTEGAHYFMYSNLTDMLDHDGTLDTLVTDAQALVEQELASKSGVSAGAVKLAYKAITSVAPGFYERVVGVMIPPMLYQLTPFWQDFHAAGGGSFGDYLAKRSDEVGPALLEVTDNMAASSEKAVVVKAYKAVRGGAQKHVEAALPALGALVEKRAG